MTEKALPEDGVQGTFASGGSTDAKDLGIPGEHEGVGMGASDEPNTFEPEEAGEAADEDDEEPTS